MGGGSTKVPHGQRDDVLIEGFEVIDGGDHLLPGRLFLGGASRLSEDVDPFPGVWLGRQRASRAPIGAGVRRCRGDGRPCGPRRRPWRPWKSGSPIEAKLQCTGPSGLWCFAFSKALDQSNEQTDRSVAFYPRQMKIHLINARVKRRRLPGVDLREGREGWPFFTLRLGPLVGRLPKTRKGSVALLPLRLFLGIPSP